MHLERIQSSVFPELVPMRFAIENNGAAFGCSSPPKAGSTGETPARIFRIVMVGVIGWLMHHLINKRKDTPKGGHRRPGAGYGRCPGQYHRQRFLRAALLGVDAPYGRTFRRTLRRIHDGQGRRHVLFPAFFQWNGVPRFLNFLVDSNNYFSGPSSTWPMPISPSPSSICFCFSTNS